MLLVLLLACPGGKDSPPPDSPTTSTSTVTDTCSTGSCNTCNEECAPRGCVGSGIYMLPGANCLACHAAGTSAGAPAFGAAGTVFTDTEGTAGAGSVTVRLLDADGKSWETTTVDNGNFAFEAPIAWPAAVEIENGNGTLQMKEAATQGACNSCHSCGGANGVKLRAP